MINALTYSLPAALLLTVIAPTAGSAEPNGCFASWSEAAPVVRRERLISIEQINRLARQHVSAEIVTSTLCRSEGQFFYRLVIRPLNGSVRTIRVDAREPFGRGHASVQEQAGGQH